MKVVRNALMSAVLIVGFFHGGVYAAAKEQEEVAERYCEEDVQAKFAVLRELLIICKNNHLINKSQCEDLIDEVDDAMRDSYDEQLLHWHDIVNKIGCLIADDTSGTRSEKLQIIWHVVTCITKGNHQKALDIMQILKKRNFVRAQHVQGVLSSSSSSSSSKIEQHDQPAADDLIVQSEQEIPEVASSSGSLEKVEEAKIDSNEGAFEKEDDNKEEAIESLSIDGHVDTQAHVNEAVFKLEESDSEQSSQQNFKEQVSDYDAAFNAQRVLDLFAEITHGNKAAIDFVQQQALEYNRLDCEVSKTLRGPEEYVIVDDSKDGSPAVIAAATEDANVQNGALQGNLAAEEIIVSADASISTEQKENVQKSEGGSFLRSIDEISCGAMAIGCAMGEVVIPLLSKNSRFVDYGPPGLATGFFVAGAAWLGLRLVNLVWKNIGAAKRTLQAETHSKNF